MEREVYLDTHVVVWLFVGQADRLSEAAISYIENSQVLISSMVRLELTYLFEVKRIQAAPDMILASLGKEINLLFRDSPFPDLINRALDKDWTRDPFDRLIVSQAELNSCPLITKDATIRKHFKGAIW